MVQVEVTAEGAKRLIYGRVRAEGNVLSLRADNAAYLLDMGWAVPVVTAPVVPAPTEAKRPRRSPPES